MKSPHGFFVCLLNQRCRCTVGNVADVLGPGRSPLGGEGAARALEARPSASSPASPRKASFCLQPPVVLNVAPRSPFQTAGTKDGCHRACSPLLPFSLCYKNKNKFSTSATPHCLEPPGNLVCCVHCPRTLEISPREGTSLPGLWPMSPRGSLSTGQGLLSLPS